MPVLVYADQKYRTLAGNKIFDGSKWVTMGSDSKIYLDGKWHDFSWKKSDIPQEPDIPSWDDFTHLATEEPTTGNVYCMTPSGSGAMNGSNWDNAWSATQINTAMLSLAPGDRLYMLEGDYGTLTTPLQPSGLVGIYGGFIEGDYSWENRDSMKHPTVLRGNGTFPLTIVNVCFDGITVCDFAGVEIFDFVNVTAFNTSITTSGILNCRVAGTSKNTVILEKADRCCFIGEAGNKLPLNIERLNDSVAICCTESEQSICMYASNATFMDIETQNSICSHTADNSVFIRCKGRVVAVPANYDRQRNYIINSAISGQVKYSTVVSCICPDLKIENSDVINSCVETSYSVLKSRIINSSLKNGRGKFENVLFVNSTCDNLIEYAVCSTFVNSFVSLHGEDITDVSNNIFWNNNGTIIGVANAQSVYSEADAVILGTDNSIARFVNTGYFPAIGIQDIGECPDPIKYPEEFSVYVASFGDWHPRSDSILVGRGAENFLNTPSDDLDGVTRPDPPTIGAYEPRPAEATE